MSNTASEELDPITSLVSTLIFSPDDHKKIDKITTELDNMLITQLLSYKFALKTSKNITVDYRDSGMQYKNSIQKAVPPIQTNTNQNLKKVVFTHREKDYKFNNPFVIGRDSSDVNLTSSKLFSRAVCTVVPIMELNILMILWCGSITDVEFYDESSTDCVIFNHKIIQLIDLNKLKTNELSLIFYGGVSINETDPKQKPIHHTRKITLSIE